MAKIANLRPTIENRPDATFELMYVLGSIPSSLMFIFYVSFFFVLFFVFFEALVLATFLSFGNLVPRSCSSYLGIETTFSLLKTSFSSSVSHEAMANLIVSFNC